ncbi:unnamed protein product (macronuclear) [Paramecium tetraurelia]|uniref:Uncharacterized protein n=1 Tax=Paramecium tetraurelia TaxID=5888 RepID=A0DTX8_PARTE|nr:uncharacterized protein GSPATT00020178001 [Paramecium tetraurelia]CAK86495.1 unnamed protein product [Paramecium tetraurelia]|eukprot:XP_001453892.1 hypothetical protein (macronuclear) [Paramecium tetraurelia strain d4-2]
MQSSRDPYHQVPMIFFDGQKKNVIKVFGNNCKNNHQFSIGWDVPSLGTVQRVSNKVGIETGFVIPDYTVITYKNINKEPPQAHNPQVNQPQSNKFATLAQKNLVQDNYKNEIIVQKSIDNGIEKFKSEENLKEQTNKQIRDILAKQRRENQQHLKYKA